MKSCFDCKEFLEIKLGKTHRAVADIYEKGVFLSGGSALLRGFDKKIAEELSIPVKVVDDPLTAVVRGTGIILEDIESSKELFVTNQTDLV